MNKISELEAKKTKELPGLREKQKSFKGRSYQLIANCLHNLKCELEQKKYLL